MEFMIDWLIDWLIDWVVFYAVSVIFQPYNGGKYTKVNVGVILCPRNITSPQLDPAQHRGHCSYERQNRFFKEILWAKHSWMYRYTMTQWVLKSDTHLSFLHYMKKFINLKFKIIPISYVDFTSLICCWHCMFRVN